MPAALGMCSCAKVRVTAGAGLPSMRPPPRPFRSQCRPRRQGDRPEGVRPPLPPPHVRAHAVQEGDANSALLPAPRPSQADGPETAARRRTRIGLGGTLQRRRPCVCPAGRRRVFGGGGGREGGRGHDSGGRAAALCRSPHALFLIPPSFPILPHPEAGRRWALSSKGTSSRGRAMRPIGTQRQSARP